MPRAEPKGSTFGKGIACEAEAGSALPGQTTVRPLPSLLLRKEVIQPHLPIRLPCYDLVPLANHTLGTCLPYGLAQRLGVQPTRLT